MKLGTQPILLLILASGSYASWFGSSDQPEPYASWSTGQLNSWLEAHKIDVPAKSAKSQDELVALVKSNWNSATVWTQDQYHNSQKSFNSVRDSTFDTWDESQLREWLLEQGVIAPKSKTEELRLLAKQRYSEYQVAASRWGNWAADATSSASDTLTSIYATATTEAAQTLDDAKDYVYSTWDDNQLRTYLTEKGLLKTKQEKTRAELLELMREGYYKVSNPVYEAWSTSYIHSWLVSHNLIAPTPTATEKARAALVEKMNNYYYTTNSYVWDTWTDSELKAWLVSNGVIKTNAQLKRDKMVKMMEDSYSSASSTIFSSWSDSHLHEWLVSKGYIRSDAQVKRDDMIKLVQEKYQAASSVTAPYLAWPNNRLRAYLAERGVTEKSIPQTREGLLQRTRSLFSTAKPQEPQTLLAKIKEVVNSGVVATEDKLFQIWEILAGYSNEKVDTAKGKAYEGKEQFDEKKNSFWGSAKEKTEEARSKVEL